jgi:glyoxylase-like metal-dependent hydrolase (beta-lactamase superfamily II)
MVLEEKHFGPVWFLPGRAGGRYPNCISVYLEGPGILIDPATDRERLQALRGDPGVKEIWLSHWHEDHIMHLDLFEDLPLVIHEKDVLPLTDMEILLDGYGMESDRIRGLWRQLMIEQFHYRPRKPTRTFQGGEVFSFGALTVEVLHTPGHTPGHCAFFFPEVGVLFTGDYDLSSFGPYYGDREATIEETIASVQRLKEISARVWMTGHKPALFEKDPAEAWDRYLGIIQRREERLLAFLEQPRTMEEIISQWIVYQKPQDPDFTERVMIGKHVEKLVREKRIIREGKTFRRTDSAST